MRRRDFLLAQILSRLVYLPFEVLILLGLAALLFGVGIAGGILDLAVVVLVGALSFAGLGTLLASRARTTETINGLINLCTLPMFLLSGVFFSSSRFPDMLQPLIRILPLTALNNALRGVINEGVSVFSLGPELLVLVAWGLLSFGLAVRLFRWTT
jgi:ABC-type multidrug transport system permease subunit